MRSQPPNASFSIKALGFLITALEIVLAKVAEATSSLEKKKVQYTDSIMLFLPDFKSFYLIFLLLSVLALVSLGSAESICHDPEDYVGSSWCDPWGGYCGECVSFVKSCTGDHRPTSRWRPGARVVDSEMTVGTAIATFVNGRYQSRYGGSSHAAIFVDFDEDGIIVYDQWRGVNVGRRLIPWSGNTLASSANAYYVIE